MPKCYRSAILTIAGMLLIAAGTSFAAVPTRMTVQGKLTNAAGDPVPAGLKSFTFKIYDAAAGGMEIWPAGPGEVQPLSTDADGLWTAEVGALVALTDPVFSGDTRWLEVTVNDGVNPAETLPRIKLNTSPYTFQAEQSNNAANAAHATDADNLGGLAPSGYALNVHSHDATTVTDEPGIASNTSYDFLTLTQGTTVMVDMITTSITIPVGGYIVVRAKTQFRTYGNSAGKYAFFQIDETAGGDRLGGAYEVEVGSGADGFYLPVVVERVYFKPAGTYAFRLEGRAYEANPGGTVTQAWAHVITATFYPTAYGPVTP